MDKKEFFEKWRKDWEERKKEFATGQAELFRVIRDRKNLEKRLSLEDSISGGWELIENSGVNPEENYVYGNLEHLSLFGIFGSYEKGIVHVTSKRVESEGAGTAGGISVEGERSYNNLSMGCYTVL